MIVNLTLSHRAEFPIWTALAWVLTLNYSLLGWVLEFDSMRRDSSSWYFGYFLLSKFNQASQILLNEAASLLAVVRYP